jgi:2-dehydro-3-deoxygalactonokinase
MASSSIGWHDLPYARTPARLDGSTLIWRDLGPIAGHPALLVSGVRSDNDVMRGEETQVLGVFAGDEPLAQSGETVIILPGTHCKHVWVADRQIQRFETFMTGELFAVLGEHSILRYSVGGAAAGQAFTAQTTEAFRAGVDTAAALPLSAALFKVRTGQVLQNRPADESRAFLSGVLIGSELAHLNAPQNDRLPIVLAAADPLQTAYQTALEALGLSARVKCVSSQAQHLLSARGQAVLLRQIGWI